MSDPGTQPPPVTNANNNTLVENDLKPIARSKFWFAFTQKSEPLLDPTVFTRPSQNINKQSSSSLGFGAPQAVFPTSTQTDYSASFSNPGTPSFGTASFGSPPFATRSSGTPAFGASPTFGASSSCASPFNGKPSFGSPAFGSSPSSFGPSKIAAPSLSPFVTSSGHTSQAPILPGDDLLSRALLRASRNRPAVFGRRDIESDRLICSYRNSCDETAKVDDLVTDLVDVAQTHPIAMSFLRQIFQKASQNEKMAPPQPPPSRHLDEQVATQRTLDYEIYTIFSRFNWSEDLCDYIVRMIVFGLAPREIRLAVKAEMDYTHGHNHVSAREVETLVDWMRGRGVDLVRDAKFTGSALDFFRPSARESRRWAIEAATNKDESKCHCDRKIGEYQSSSDSSINASNAAGGLHQAAREQGEGEQNDVEFRFMNLPAELRDWVYKCAVTPTGFISLRSCAHHMPAGVYPPVAASFYRVSKIVNKEAGGLLMENTIIVNGCLEYGSRSVIHRAQLPEHILPVIKSLVLVVDFTRIVSSARVADWRAAQGLTGLKKLQICGIATTDPTKNLSSWLATHLRMILERVPADCDVSFGEDSRGSAVDLHVKDMVKKITAAGPDILTATAMYDAYSIEGEVLESTWTEIENDVVRGCKSGFKGDFRFEDRKANGEMDEHWRELRQRKIDYDQQRN